MLERLISSQSRLAILSLFFNRKEETFSATDVVRELSLDRANVHKELANLVAGGFLAVAEEGNKKRFQANQEGRYFLELSTILAKYQRAGSGEEIFCLEEMPNYYPLFTSPAWNARMANDLSALYGFKASFRTLVTIFEDNYCQLLAGREDFLRVNAEIFERVRTDGAWRERYMNDLEERATRLYQASDHLKKTNLRSLSDEKLAGTFEEFFHVYTDLHMLHIPQTALDFGEGAFSKYLMSYLEPRVRQAGLSLGDCFSVLTTPLQPSRSAEEYRDLLKILEKVGRRAELKDYFSSTESRIIAAEISRKDEEIAGMISRHADKFGSLGYGMVGPNWGQEYFIDILGSLIRQHVDPARAEAEGEAARQKTENRQRELAKVLGIDREHLDIFQFARDLVYTKGARKDAMFDALSVLENILREVSRRRFLSLRQIRYLTPEELPALLRGTEISAQLLNDRYRYSVYFSSVGREPIFLTGDKAKKFVAKLNIVKEQIADVKMLSGDCASPGRARGEAKVINVIADMAKMNDGDILISIATTPDLVPAIKKAAAIVTDVGGITCHAAIISRELGIPCVVGTKIATKVIKDKAVVDVDATHGKVDIISQ